jgi:hypothetical protein
MENPLHISSTIHFSREQMDKERKTMLLIFPLINLKTNMEVNPLLFKRNEGVCISNDVISNRNITTSIML